MRQVNRSSRPNTQNAGASLERQAILSKIRREYKRLPPLQNKTRQVVGDLIIWIQKRTDRDNKAVGGLGRK